MSVETLKTFIDKLEDSFKAEGVSSSNNESKYGVIRSFKDGVITIEGLTGLKMSEVVTIKDTNIKALIMNLEKNVASGLVLQSSEDIKAGMLVESNGETLSTGVGEGYIGRVIDSLGNPLDDEGEIKTKDTMPLEKIAPGVITRQSVSEPVQTGILAIDALVPIGRGQRELIIGDRQTGKTTIAIDTILNQKDENMICIYVAIGQRESKIANVYNTLKSRGAMDYTIIVSASASTSAVLQFLAPYTGSSLAEYFLDQGKDVLIVYDDLSKHAVSYREMSLLLRRPPGREAYPGDVFYIHSRLLERAVKLNKNYGGGSITALPIIETQAGDVSAYIPTNVISITDGQIFLDTDLFNQGILPAINVGISVSRVGGAAQTKIMKKVAGTMKLDLASYYELESFSQFASDLDEATKKTLNRGQKIVSSMIQKQNSPYKLWEEVVIVWAATKGYLDDYGKDEIAEILRNMLVEVSANHKSLIDEIMKEKALTEKISSDLDKTIKSILEK